MLCGRVRELTITITAAGLALIISGAIIFGVTNASGWAYIAGVLAALGEVLFLPAFIYFVEPRFTRNITEANRETNAEVTGATAPQAAVAVREAVARITNCSCENRHIAPG